MKTRRSFTSSLLCSLLLIAEAHGSSPGRPNVLLLMAEDLSPRVGAFGDPIAVTPNIDRMAAEGVRYTNAFTTAGVCSPSRAAHITGMHQISIGAQHMRASSAPSGEYLAVPPSYVKAYPELLRAAGYFTFTGVKLDYQFSGSVAGSGPFTIWNSEGIRPHWRDAPDQRPFFGLINLRVTHESGIFQPLGNWPNSFAHFQSQLLRAFESAVGQKHLTGTDPDTVEIPPYFPDTATVRADIARHYDNIATMDAQVGTLLDQLQEDGLAENTIVIWTADHGDGLPRSKREIYDSGIHVPLVSLWPDEDRPPGVQPGSVDTRLVSLIDLAPTILRIAGAEVPGYLHGRDIVADEPRRYIYAARDRINEVPDRQRAVWDERYKYIRSWHPELGGGHPLVFRENMDMVREMQTMYARGELSAEQRLWFEPPGEEQLYDTLRDPHELNNLAGNSIYKEQLNRLRDELDNWLRRVGDWSEEPEAVMAARFMPNGEAPNTRPPTYELDGNSVTLNAQDNASIGFRLDAGPWKLYTSPFTLSPGAEMEARAIRYGWKESESTILRFPE